MATNSHLNFELFNLEEIREKRQRKNSAEISDSIEDSLNEIIALVTEIKVLSRKGSDKVSPNNQSEIFDCIDELQYSASELKTLFNKKNKNHWKRQ